MANKETTKKLVATKRVKNVLFRNLESRDNDSILYATLLKEEYNCSDNMRYGTMEKRVREGVLPSRDLVSRIRRKLQNEDKTIRGTLWNKRHRATTNSVG